MACEKNGGWESEKEDKCRQRGYYGVCEAGCWEGGGEGGFRALEVVRIQLFGR